MTKKQFVKKMRRLQKNLYLYTKAQGRKANWRYEEVNTPNWNSEITVGKYKGQKLKSYQQAWDIMVEVLKGTPCMEGIE